MRPNPDDKLRLQSRIKGRLDLERESPGVTQKTLGLTKHRRNCNSPEAMVYNIVELLSQEDVVERRRPQREAWCPALSMDQFLEREEKLAAMPWSKSNMRTWILVHGDDDGVGDVNERALASLEIYKLDWVIGPNGLRGTAYGIASGFTEPHKRGKGYAPALGRLVRDWMREADPLVMAVVLFSDVGPDVWGRAGFMPTHPTPVDHCFELHSHADSLKRAEEASRKVTWLTRLEVGEVVDSFSREIEGGVKADEFVVLPCATQVEWLLEREVVVASTLNRTPLPRSAATCGSALLVWTADMSKHKSFLKILLFRGSEDESCTAAVVAGAVVTALEGGVYAGGIHMWAEGVCGKWPASNTALHEAGVSFVEKPREGGLPMLASLNPTVDAHKWKFVPQAVWL